MSARLARMSVVGLGILASTAAMADPRLRFQADQRGDLVLVGNTLGQNCSKLDGGVLPGLVVGTVGQCGASGSDSAADVFWQVDVDAGTAFADLSIDPLAASSAAVLNLPADAQVTYARLYWSAKRASSGHDGGITPDLDVSFGGPNFLTTVVADSAPNDVWATRDYYYQASADVTGLVVDAGLGVYSVGDVAALDVRGLFDQTAYSAWSLAIVYQSPTELERDIAIFDGLDLVRSGFPAKAVIQGFHVPDAGFDAKLSVVAYEGDNSTSGDQLFFDGIQGIVDGGYLDDGGIDEDAGFFGAIYLTLDGGPLSDTLNAGSNFFNGTHDYLGQPVSNVGDLPQLSGARGSFSGVDLDTVNVSSRLSNGQSSAIIRATSSSDRYLLGVVGTAIASYSPVMLVDKTVSGPAGRGSGPFHAGDQVTYTIRVKSSGNDSATQIVVVDPLSADLRYVPGSMQIVTAPSPGALTDTVGDDRGEYDVGTNSVIVHLGSGANATDGGRLDTGAEQAFSFRATIALGAASPVSNQAQTSFSGLHRAPTDSVASGDGTTPGAPTLVTLTPVPDPAFTNPANGGYIALTPSFSGTGEPGDTVTVTVDGNVACTALVNAQGSWSCTASASVGEGTHTVSASQTTAGGAQSGSVSVSVSVDTLAPDTTITSGPTGTVSQTSASFEFTGSDPAPSSGPVSFECSLDGQTFAPCPGPTGSASYPNVAPGAHTFAVRAVDPVGNADPTPATQDWTISEPSTTGASGSTSGTTGLGGKAGGSSGGNGQNNPQSTKSGGCGCSGGGADLSLLALGLLAGLRRKRA